MKKTGKWIIGLIARIAILMLLFMAGRFVYYQYILPDLTGEIRIQSRILEQKLESSQRLEITTIDEEGVLDAKTNVIILGTVGSTTIRYRYTASIGIDLSKVIMTADTDRIIFTLPETEILNDGIEALEISKHDLFSKMVDKSVETLLAEQRLKCREQYFTEEQHSAKFREDAEKAFNETICQWLESYGERHYGFEIRFRNDTAAE